MWTFPSNFFLWTLKTKYSLNLQRDRTTAILHYLEGIPVFSSRIAMLMLFMALIILPHQMCVQLSLSVSLRSCSLSLHVWFYMGNAKQHISILVILFAQWNYNRIFFIVTSDFSALNEPSISPPSRVKEKSQRNEKKTREKYAKMSSGHTKVIILVDSKLLRLLA